MTALRRIGIALALALVACAGCSDWKRFAYEGWGRDDWQQPERVVAALGLEPGDRVADLGAGGGYFSFRLAGGGVDKAEFRVFGGCCRRSDVERT